MRICFDLDETLCTGYPYEISTPLPGARELLSELHNQGHRIIIQTARGMSRGAGNPGIAVATIGDITIRQLKEWGFIYDELYFGKPSADYYVDDKSVSSLFHLCYCLGIMMPDQDNTLLEYRVGQLESKIVSHAKETNLWFQRIEDKLDGYLRRTDIMEVKHDELAGKVEKLEKAQSQTEKSLPALAAGGGAGGIIVAMIEAIKYFLGQN